MSVLHEEIKRIRTEVAVNQDVRKTDGQLLQLMHHNQERNNNDGYRDSTFLYVKSFTGDSGGRPIPGGTVF
ncbi:MAG: hypothetical protein WKF70_14570, partial [Chitinophagaceae bacterium]